MYLYCFSLNNKKKFSLCSLNLLRILSLILCKDIYLSLIQHELWTHEISLYKNTEYIFSMQFQHYLVLVILLNEPLFVILKGYIGQVK